MPFPLSKRQTNMFVQCFNTLDENNKLTYVLTSIDTPEPRPFIPAHVTKHAQDFLIKNQEKISKRKTVRLDILMICGEFHFHDENTFTLTEYSNLDPNISINMPKTFEKLFIQSFVNGKFEILRSLMGKNYSKKGFTGTPYENFIKNFKSNPEKKLFENVQKDMANFIMRNKKAKM